MDGKGYIIYDAVGVVEAYDGMEREAHDEQLQDRVLYDALHESLAEAVVACGVHAVVVACDVLPLIQAYLHP